MYQFTEQEFAVLEAAHEGTLEIGTVEYEAAVAAVSRVVDYSVPFQSTIEAEVDKAARALINGILVENSNKPNAAFYTFAAYFAEQSGTSEDANTIAWLRGAAGVNRGDTVASNFIRDYTAAQIFARSGQTITEDQLQFASDRIARDVFTDIENGSLTLPSILQIGTNDITGTLDGLRSFGLPDDFAIWSGNLLFPVISPT